jgi:N-acetylglucosaminyl-diphospho-decaprenol L-rhamnosyltransferase
MKSMTDRRPVGDVWTGVAITLSIIIATYNARELLAVCLASIYQNPPSEPYEIIVVDDASVDATSEMVRSRFPDVRLFTNETNRHYANSNNLAFEHARGHYLYLLNNDTIMLTGALDRMIAYLRQHPEVGVVGSKLLNDDGTIQWSVKTLPNIGSALFGARSIITRMFPNNPFSQKHLLHLNRDLSYPFIAGYLSSASMMMPCEVVRKVGGLDKRLSYHVDADYCKRITDLGYQCLYLPDSAVIHLNHKGGTMVSRSRRFRSVIEFHRGSYIFFRKHIRQTAGIATCIIVPVGLLFRFLFCIVAQAMTEILSTAFVCARESISGLTRRPKSALPLSPAVKRRSISE